MPKFLVDGYCEGGGSSFSNKTIRSVDELTAAREAVKEFYIRTTTDLTGNWVVEVREMKGDILEARKYRPYVFNIRAYPRIEVR